MSKCAVQPHLKATLVACLDPRPEHTLDQRKHQQQSSARLLIRWMLGITIPLVLNRVTTSLSAILKFTLYFCFFPLYFSQLYDFACVKILIWWEIMIQKVYFYLLTILQGHMQINSFSFVLFLGFIKLFFSFSNLINHSWGEKNICYY